MTKINLISYATQYRSRNVPIEMPSLHSKIDILQSEDIEVNGVITHQSRYVTDDSSHRYDGLKASDFEPQNIVASGVNPSPVKFQLPTFEALAYTERQVQSLTNLVQKSNSNS